jgi:Fe-S cluster assembly iron-binding protein IscA
MMHLDLVDGSCERWVIRVRPGHLAGIAVARADGITLFSPAEQSERLSGLELDYRGDLSGGGFLVRAGRDLRVCACGAAFGPAADPPPSAGQATK